LVYGDSYRKTGHLLKALEKDLVSTSGFVIGVVIAVNQDDYGCLAVGTVAFQRDA
jgi:hypothetical protein